MLHQIDPRTRAQREPTARSRAGWETVLTTPDLHAWTRAPLPARVMLTPPAAQGRRPSPAGGAPARPPGTTPHTAGRRTCRAERGPAPAGAGAPQPACAQSVPRSVLRGTARGPGGTARGPGEPYYGTRYGSWAGPQSVLRSTARGPGGTPGGLVTSLRGQISLSPQAVPARRISLLSSLWGGLGTR